MAGINWSELFPTRISGFIFIAYMSLFVCQGILVTASQEGADNGYGYNTVTVVLMTEVLKLLISGGIFCKQNSIKSLFVNIIKGAKVLLLYFIPAFLYCLYNNLAFINLSKFDPTTYFLLLQVRVVITGILFQLIFKKYLSKKQWFSLILLTIGCMVKQLNFGQDITLPKDSLAIANGKNMTGFDLSLNAVFILIQTVCSCLAGVYNEYLLKHQGSDVNIYIQNVYMYLDSIACNGVILLLQGNFFSAFSSDSLQSIFQFKVILIMLNNAAIGIITSFFLKYMNSILKTFASALELLLTAILSYILFSIPIYLNTALAIGIVSFSIYLYSQSPVVNLADNQKSLSLTTTTTTTTEDMKSLLADTDEIEEV